METGLCAVILNKTDFILFFVSTIKPTKWNLNGKRVASKQHEDAGQIAKLPPAGCHPALQF